MATLIVNATDTNKQNSAFFVKEHPQTVVEILRDMLNFPKYKLGGIASLWLSHLVWDSTEAQELLGTKEICGRVLEIVDFENLVNEGEEEAGAEQLMEMSFYALLALINLSHGNARV